MICLQEEFTAEQKHSKVFYCANHCVELDFVRSVVTLRAGWALEKKPTGCSRPVSLKRCLRNFPSATRLPSVSKMKGRSGSGSRMIRGWSSCCVSSSNLDSRAFVQGTSSGLETL